MNLTAPNGNRARRVAASDTDTRLRGRGRGRPAAAQVAR